MSSWGFLWKRDDSLPVGVAFQYIRIISPGVRAVVPVMRRIVFRRFFNVSCGCRLDYHCLGIRVIGRVRIIGAIRGIRPDGATKHDPDGSPRMAVVTVSMIPARKSAGKNQASGQNHDQKKQGAFHLLAFCSVNNGLSV